MALKYEIKAKQGTYTNQNGEEKANWVKIGAVFETQKGLSIKLEAIPIGWDGWASLYLPKQKADKDPFADVVVNNNPDIISEDIPF